MFKCSMDSLTMFFYSFKFRNEPHGIIFGFKIFKYILMQNLKKKNDKHYSTCFDIYK